MRRGKTVDQWRTLIYSSPHVSDAVRVSLLLLADHMGPDRIVSVPRADLAKALNRHPQRIAERSAAAVELGFLSVVKAGYRGNTAIYQGTFPSEAHAMSKRVGREQRKGRKRTVWSTQRTLRIGTHWSPIAYWTGSTPLVTKDRLEPDRRPDRSASITSVTAARMRRGGRRERDRHRPAVPTC